MTDFLSEALNLAEKGFAVFPLKPKGKTPATAHGCKDATTDKEQILSWWTEHPDCNIGIATGSASGGLVVIDVDNGHGGSGSTSLREWCLVNGDLPDTLTCLTGSGGEHYYYFDSEPFKNAAGIIKHVDIRAEGGYVVAPPSVHPNGNIYEWDAMSMDYEIPRDNAQVRRFLGSRKRQETQAAQMPDTFSEGSRTDNLIRMIGSLTDRGLSQEAITAAIIAENNARCVPPLTMEELQKEVFPAFERGWVPEHPYTKHSGVRILPDPVRLDTVWDDPPPLAPVLIDGVLRQGHKMIVSAPSKAGKSFALMRLAIGIAEGMKWFGSECRQGKVLFVNMEIDGASCYNRFRAIYKAMGMNFDIHAENLTIWNLRGFSMPLSDLTPHIIREAGKDYAAIIIDPLYKVMDGDENSNSDIGRMVGHFDRIARETGASVIYAHHFAKGTGGDRDTIDRGAGAGTFSRDPDAILTMTQLEMEDEVNEVHTAWRMEYVLREFPNKKPVSFWWEYPVHRMDPYLDEEIVQTSATKAAKQKRKISEAKQKEKNEHVHDAVNRVIDLDGKFQIGRFMDAYSVYEKLSRNTAKERLRSAGYELEQVPEGKPQLYWERVKK